MIFVQSLIRFWLHHPALLCGLSFLLGFYCNFHDYFLLIIPCLSLWLPLLIAAITPTNRTVMKLLALSLLMFCTAWGTAALYYSFPPTVQPIRSGRAHVKIDHIALQRSMFGTRWLYHCKLLQFYPEEGGPSLVSSLPCLIAFPAQDREKQPRPPAHQEYWVSGKLLKTDQGTYRLRVSASTLWTPIPDSWSWAEWRHRWKKNTGTWIASHFSDPINASFLSGLTTGEFDDYWMRQQFSRFGLQHLLAISGFHFAIVAGFLNFILGLFLPRPIRLIGLLICLGGYAFFLGPQPSILRAWIMCSLTLVGGLIDKQPTALNSLGFSLLVILGYDPLLCEEVSFQLSFAATAAILILYQPIESGLCSLFSKRSLSEVIQMNSLNQHGYCVLVFLRRGLALALAVNGCALPLTLYYFHQFPWISLLYNLFFPFLASGSLCLLLLGSLFSFIPFAAENIHRLNEAYTSLLLQLTYQMPEEIDHYLTVESLSPFWVVCYLSIAFLIGILWKEKSGASPHEQTFSFI